jgi:hypothetical protein
MGSRYLFIVLYCLIERLLSRGDYRRKPVSDTSVENPEAVCPATEGTGQVSPSPSVARTLQKSDDDQEISLRRL